MRGREERGLHRPSPGKGKRVVLLSRLLSAVNAAEFDGMGGGVEGRSHRRTDLVVSRLLAGGKEMLAGARSSNQHRKLI